MLSMFKPMEWIALGLGIVCVCLFLVAGAQRIEIGSLRTQIAEEAAAREKAAREATARIAALQATHAIQQQELTDDYEKRLAEQARVVANASDDADRLRQQLERFAASGGDSSETTAATVSALRAKLATLGKLYARLDQRAGRYAAAADLHVEQARALRRQIDIDRAACDGVSNPASTQQ